IILLIVGVMPWHSSMTTPAYPDLNRLIEFFTVNGEPNTTLCRVDLEPALAENIEHGSPVSRYLAAFCSISSFDGAKHNTRLPPLTLYRKSAIAAIRNDFPAAGAASMIHGSTDCRRYSTSLSWHVCWYGLSWKVMSHSP